jgi:hypothetical protein
MHPHDSTVAHDPAALADAVVAAWNDHDLDRILAFYTDDATLRRQPPFDGGRVYRGKEEIGSWVAPLLPGFRADLHERRVDGNTVTWSETVTYDWLRQRGIDTIEVTVEVTLRGDKVASSVIILTPETAARMQAARMQSEA